ncbi:hypothetical protein FQP90_14085 [Paenarthrobacter nitroguajacolicus]|uniref:Uncharacterized protein n=1 Tax=Paenarthrobacter nitroguajacolicus TaxID=211146 RepID=A0A558GXT2_PAENT|nr:hypothetical protein [Paenarthrobacter nitroguajacolicus]TVU61659.1 hypothetical protein FQP90_14085 [Paenarthrobacter nitroguajacolicus]
MSSQEQRPIRSRRELRRAREEHPEAQAETTAPAGAEPVMGAERANSRNRRAADAPVDAVGPAAQERSSQIRARDRAALRTIKELADKEEQLSGGGPPTRRQLRLQQLQAEVATSMNPIVPAPGSAPDAAKPEAPQAPSKEKAPALSSPPSDGGETQDPSAESEMSVEQALAVRELIAAQVQNQTAKLEHIAEQDPLAVDPEVLAQQIALAERAAVLNKRAAAKQKLAEQNQTDKGKAPEPKVPAEPKSPAVTAGPSTANNLAMVTPLEFVKVPGVERPVMKRPSTTFVPLITSAGPKLDAVPPTGREQGSRGRAGVLARAEAVARSVRKKPVMAVEPSEETQRPPVSASTAYGLDPLDVNTAGLARAQRNRLLQYGVLALGLVALIVGIIMITSG